MYSERTKGEFRIHLKYLHIYYILQNQLVRLIFSNAFPSVFNLN